MRAADRNLLSAILATGAMVLLIAFAVTDTTGWFVLAILIGVSGSVAFFFTAFPGSLFFTIAFANFLAVYTCIFVVFLDTSFKAVTGPFREIAYLLPMIGFIAGSWLRRESIRDIVVAHRFRQGGRFRRGLRWVFPLVLIGTATFAVPEQALGVRVEGYLLIVAMAVIAVLVSCISSSISAFLLDTGLLFEAFFKRAQRISLPAFAFCTFYSVNIIVFASIYRIVDRVTDAPQFVVDGLARAITFQESLYFSIITLSTVGYGDIVPASSALRALSSVQIVLGVLVLLFGFSEIMSYSRERSSQQRD